MGRVKSALRAYALECESPQQALERTDRKVQHFEVGTMITVVCVVSSPPYDRFDICSAGHPPPVLAVPGHEAEFVDVRPIRRSAPYLTSPAPPGPSRCLNGATLLLYTDGLVEDPDQLDRRRPSQAAIRSTCRRSGHRLPDRDAPPHRQPPAHRRHHRASHAPSRLAHRDVTRRGCPPGPHVYSLVTGWRCSESAWLDLLGWPPAPGRLQTEATSRVDARRQVDHQAALASPTSVCRCPSH